MDEIAAVFLRDSDDNIRAHPLHRKWLNSVDADELIFDSFPELGMLENSIIRDGLLNRRIPNDLDYNIIVFESAASLYCAPLIARKSPDTILVALDATWRTCGTEAYNFDRFPFHKKAAYYCDRWLDGRFLRTIIDHYIDGVITVSKMKADQIRSFSSLPLEIVRPHIESELARKLARVSPDLENDMAVFLGANRDHKGVDLLVDCWPKVREQFPEAKLRIAGRDHPDVYENVPGVSVLGFVSDRADLFQSASIQIHPARFDASPVSTLEGMRAGLPQIVSDRTGTKSEVMRVDGSLVVKPFPDTIARRIINYFKGKSSSKARRSSKSKKIAGEFEAASREGDFSEGLNRLISRL